MGKVISSLNDFQGHTIRCQSRILFRILMITLKYEESLFNEGLHGGQCLRKNCLELHYITLTQFIWINDEVGTRV